MAKRYSGRNMGFHLSLDGVADPVKISYLSEYDISSSSDQIEVTAGGDTNKTYVPGLPDFSGSVSGFYDYDLTGAADPLWLASRDGVARQMLLYPNEATVAATTATVSNKALTDNVATLTTSAAHTFLVGQRVTVTGVDATFNGTYQITAVPSTTTFSYAKVAANVASAVATGTASRDNRVVYYGPVYVDFSHAAGVSAAGTVSANLTAAGSILRSP